MTDGLSVVVARLCHRCNLGQRGPGRSPGNAFWWQGFRFHASNVHWNKKNMTIAETVRFNLCLINILFIIFMQKFEEPETEVKWQLIIIVSLTRSSAVAERPRDALYH